MGKRTTSTKEKVPRVLIEITGNNSLFLTAISKNTGKTKSQIIREALAIYDVIINKTQEGNKLMMIGKNGTKTEIILIS